MTKVLLRDSNALHHGFMSDAAIDKPQSARVRSLILPREHGAWGILLVPLATGAAVGLLRGGHPAPLLLLTLAALALFCLRTPLEVLLGASPLHAAGDAERRAVILVTAVTATLAFVALDALLWNGHNPGLLMIGAVAALLFGLRFLLRRWGRRTRMPAQLIGALGLTSTAAAAYYVATGHFDSQALALWLANWMFAGNQIHFVQLRIHGARLDGFEQKFARGTSFFFGQIIMLAVLAAAWDTGLLPWLALLAFLPIFLRGMRWFFSGPAPLRVHHLGISELAHAISFGVLLILSFRLTL